jgi:hypothetical protein
MRRDCPLISVTIIRHFLLELIEVFEAGEDDLLAGLLDLAGEEDLVEDGVDLVEVEDEIELADVAEEGVEDLDEEVDGLEVGELVIVGVDAGAEKEARIPPIHHLVVPELDEVGLVFLVARRYETVDLFTCERKDGNGELAQSLKFTSDQGKKEKRKSMGAYLAFQLDLLVICIWHIPLREPGFAPEVDWKHKNVNTAWFSLVFTFDAVFYSLSVLY